MGLVVQQDGAGSLGMAEHRVELTEGVAHDVGRCGRVVGIRRINAHLADADPLRSQPARSALDRLSDRCQRIGTPDQSFAVFGDGLGQANVITVAVAQLTPQGQPAGTLRASGELAEEHRLASAAQAGQRPVGMQRWLLQQPVLESGQQPVTARQVRRRNAVAGPERVGQRIRLSGERRTVHRIVSLVDWLDRPGSAAWRLPGLSPHLIGNRPTPRAASGGTTSAISSRSRSRRGTPRSRPRCRARAPPTGS